jgi:hypothetical protein
MKLRRLSLVCAMLLLVMTMLVLPVQAGGPPKTTFIAYNTSFDYFTSVCTYTGKSSHCINSFGEGIGADDARFTGSLTAVAHCSGPGLNHPQATEIGWGPCDGTWRLDVPVLGGWWEGQLSALPQADYRNGGIARGIGKGYGAFKGLTVEWHQDFVWEWGVQRTVTIKSDN